MLVYTSRPTRFESSALDADRGGHVGLKLNSRCEEAQGLTASARAHLRHASTPSERPSAITTEGKCTGSGTSERRDQRFLVVAAKPDQYSWREHCRFLLRMAGEPSKVRGDEDRGQAKISISKPAE